MKKSDVDDKFHHYNASADLSVFDLIARTSLDPIILYPCGDAGSVIFVQFYSLKWSGGYVREDRGLGHGSNLRKWTFFGQARTAISGTITNMQWDQWVEAELEMVESRREFNFRMK